MLAAVRICASTYSRIVLLQYIMLSSFPDLLLYRTHAQMFSCRTISPQEANLLAALLLRTSGIITDYYSFSADIAMVKSTPSAPTLQSLAHSTASLSSVASHRSSPRVREPPRKITREQLARIIDEALVIANQAIDEIECALLPEQEQAVEGSSSGPAASKATA